MNYPANNQNNDISYKVNNNINNNNQIINDLFSSHNFGQTLSENNTKPVANPINDDDRFLRLMNSDVAENLLVQANINNKTPTVNSNFYGSGYNNNQNVTNNLYYTNMPMNNNINNTNNMQMNSNTYNTNSMQMNNNMNNMGNMGNMNNMSNMGNMNNMNNMNNMINMNTNPINTNINSLNSMSYNMNQSNLYTSNNNSMNTQNTFQSTIPNPQYLNYSTQLLQNTTSAHVEHQLKCLDINNNEKLKQEVMFKELVNHHSNQLTTKVNYTY